MATAPTVQQASLSRELFGLTVKHAAVIFAVVYGIGFLVLSIHHARFGMEATEPFKPKVFSAGVLFVLLAGVPCVAMARLLAMFGLRMRRTYTVVGKGAAYVRAGSCFGILADCGRVEDGKCNLIFAN